MTIEKLDVQRYIASSRDPLYERSTLHRYRTADPEPGDVFAETLFEHARTKPLVVSIGFGGIGVRNSQAVLNQDFVAGMLQGLSRLQRIAMRRGDRFEVYLWFSTDRVAPKTQGVQWDTEFPIDLVATAELDETLERLFASGYPERGAPRNVLDPTFWLQSALSTMRRGGIPLAYSGDGVRSYYNVLAVILDPTAPHFDEWILHTMARTMSLIYEATGLFFGWCTTSKDKAYWRRPEFNEPGRDGWYWVHQHPLPLPVWAEAQTGLWCQPHQYTLRPNHETRADLAEKLQDIGIPAIHRIWRPRGVSYEDFFGRHFEGRTVHYID